MLQMKMKVFHLPLQISHAALSIVSLSTSTAICFFLTSSVLIRVVVDFSPKVNLDNIEIRFNVMVRDLKRVVVCCSHQ